MLDYLFFLFAIVVFLVLVRETIIDIKTMYVPDNITFSIYTASFLFLISSLLITKSWDTVLDGVFGFLLGFGVPFLISFVSYIIRLASHKMQKKNQPSSGAEDVFPVSVPQTEDKKPASSQKRKIYRRTVYWIFCLFFIIAVSFIQSAVPQMLFLGIGILTLVAAVFSYEKTKKIEFPLYAASAGLLVLALAVKNEPAYLLLFAGAIVAEWILARVYRRFYKIETEADEEDTADDAVEGGIGGGDILIFGALGLMFGVKGIITILLYSVFLQLLVIVSYFILAEDKNAFGYAPFVPGIALGTYFYIMGFDLLNISQALSFFWGV